MNTSILTQLNFDVNQKGVLLVLTHCHISYTFPLYELNMNYMSTYVVQWVLYTPVARTQDLKKRLNSRPWVKSMTS